MIKNGLNPRFAEIGKIKIGGKGDERTAKNGKKYKLPVKYNHFVVTTTEKGPDGNFLPNKEIMKALGPNPKELPIRFPFDDIDMNFYTSFQFYKGKKCLCHGDGEYATRYKDGNESRVECNPAECKFLQNTINEVDTKDKCKPSGILSCYLPMSSDIGGIFRFRTHSWNSVSGILAALKSYHIETNGILRQIPFKLKLIKKATAEHGNVSVVTIVFDGVEIERVRQIARDEYVERVKIGIDMKRIESEAKKAGFTVDTDDPADVEEEFYNTVPVVEPDKIKENGFTAEDVTDKINNKEEKEKVDSPVKQKKDEKIKPVPDSFF